MIMADNSHLNDREFAQALVEVSGRARIHLEQCAACREEFDCWQQSLALMPGNLRAAAELPADFWQDQRFAIARMLRSAPAPRPALPALAWAATFVLLLCGLLLLGNSPKPAPAQASADPDHQMLLEVEDALNSDVPEALEPAALLAQEIGGQMETRSSSHSPKEINHEN
jgi:hypothetical protein